MMACPGDVSAAASGRLRRQQLQVNSA